jgi:ABC-2 type transport system permease protein
VLTHKILAFIKRDFTIESSYKFAFLFELLTSVFPVLSFYFIGKLVDSTNNTSLTKYGGQYFPFAMVGVAFTQYFMLALRTFAGAIRRSQLAGCLEAMLSTQTQAETIIVLSSLYGFLMKTVHVAMIFAVGGLILDVDYGNANILGTIATLVLTILTFSALGIFSAAIITVLKKGDPIEWIFGSLCSLLGGALFPITIMPNWMQKIAAILPITYSLDSMRLAVLKGHSIPMLWKQLSILGGMSIVLLPLSVWFFSRAVNKGRRDGTLMLY